MVCKRRIFSRRCDPRSVLGPAGAALQRGSRLPAAVLRALPAIRDPNGTLAAIPALLYPDAEACRVFSLIFGGAAGA